MLAECLYVPEFSLMLRLMVYINSFFKVQRRFSSPVSCFTSVPWIYWNLSLFRRRKKQCKWNNRLKSQAGNHYHPDYPLHSYLHTVIPAATIRSSRASPLNWTERGSNIGHKPPEAFVLLHWGLSGLLNLPPFYNKSPPSFSSILPERRLKQFSSKLKRLHSLHRLP